MTTTTTTKTNFQIHAIPPEVFDHVRASCVDVSGNPVELLTATGSEPLRCCLRDAEGGEQVILFGYEPPIPASPYREVGPVFGHAEHCEGPMTSTATRRHGADGHRYCGPMTATAGSTPPPACTTAPTPRP
jgi:hypothetical protein